MKSSTKTAVIVVLAIVAAGGALAAGYGLSNTFHNWVDGNVLRKETVYVPNGAIENDDGTITVKTSFAHQEKTSSPFTGNYAYYTLPDFTVSDYHNSNGKLRVANALYSNGETAQCIVDSNVNDAYINLLAEDPYAHAEDVKFYNDYDEGLAKEEGAFFYAPYAEVKDFTPEFSAKVKTDKSIEVTVTYVPLHGKYTGKKKATTTSSQSSSTSVASSTSGSASN